MEIIMNASKETIALFNNIYDHTTGLFHLSPELSVTFEELEEVQRILPVDTDSYKVSMWKQYPKGTKIVRSYIESRGGRFDRVLHFGVQSWLHTIAKPFTKRQIDIAEVLWKLHGEPFPRVMWDYVLEKHGGVPPIRVLSAPEGLVVPTRNVVVVIENTDTEMPNPESLTTWGETSCLRAVWYPSTVATMSWHIKQLIKDYYQQSVPEENWDASLPFRLHDFGSRGTSSNETAAIGGTAHLINFLGTDTFAAIPWAIRHYYARPQELGFSIAAMEHSTVTSWGRASEDDAFYNMVETYANSNVPFATVIDSYDPIAATQRITAPAGRIVQLLKERNALMVLRPDSGDPIAIIPQMLAIIEKNVGSTVNRKGYKVLNHFRIIWGDGINLMTIESILRMCVGMLGYAADNFAFGMGGALLQVTNRDDQMYAMKCSAIYVEGEGWREVYKQPAGVVMKASKKGRVSLYKNDQNQLVNLTDDDPMIEGMECMLHEVFNGKMVKEWTFPEVRANSNLPLMYNAPVGHSKKVYAPL
jgi:nicotinamide phosphoribosyltransferase